MRVLRLTILGFASSLALIACGSSAVSSAPAVASSADAPTTTRQASPAEPATSTPPTTPPPTATTPVSPQAPTTASPTTASPTTASPTIAESTLNLLDTALENGSFNILSSLLGTADLIGTLDGEGPFTVFAPTDDAFAVLPPGLLDALGRPDNHDALVRVLTYHVVAGRLAATSLVAGPLATLEGSSAMVSVQGSVKMDAANVTATDVQATNGVIHMLDAVLLPPGLDVAAILAPPTTQALRPKATTAPHSTDAPAPQPTDAPHST